MTESDPPAPSSDKIDVLLRKGDIASNRSRERATKLLPDFKVKLGLPAAVDPQLDRIMEDFIAETVLGAAWYQKRYGQAKWKARLYIALNSAAVVGLPLVLIGLSKLAPAGGVTSQVTSQVTAVLTGILALQKTLSAWYGSQQRYAIWYKSASDLKTIYYGIVQAWTGKAERNRVEFGAALTTGTIASHKIISDEQLDFYQKLVLPSFDVLDLLTSSRSTVSGLVTSLLPGKPAIIVAAGKNALAAPAPPAASQLEPILPQQRATGEFLLVPGGRRHRSRIHRIASGQGIAFPEPSGKRVSQRHEPGPLADANWITCAWINTGKRVRSFTSTWTVPDSPRTQASQLIYLFNGLEPADGSMVLQPVLQWGDYGTDNDDVDRSGPFWTVASWLVTDTYDSAHHTDHVRVYPGATVTGVITLVGRDADKCIYACEFQGIAGTKLTTPPIPELTYCVEALEAYELLGSETPSSYDLNVRTEYPPSGPVVFKSIDVVTDSSDAMGTWATCDWAPQFGEGTSIANNASANLEVSICFE